MQVGSMGITMKAVYAKCHQLLREFSANPTRGIFRLWLIAESRLGIQLWWIHPARRSVRSEELEVLLPAPAELCTFGNYRLAPRVATDSTWLVYSAGVGGEVSFDLAIRAAGADVYLFDPTPIAKETFFGIADKTRLNFVECAVSDHSGRIQLYADRHVQTAAMSSSFSVMDRAKSGLVIEVNCIRLPEFARQNGHALVSVLKFDIEGAGVRVIRDCLDSGLLPGQIVGEIEFELGSNALKVQLEEAKSLVQLLKDCGYRCYSITKSQFGVRWEVLAVRSQCH